MNRLQVYDWLFIVFFTGSVVGIILGIMNYVTDRWIAVIIMIPLVLGMSGYCVLGIKIYEGFTKPLRVKDGVEGS